METRSKPSYITTIPFYPLTSLLVKQSTKDNRPKMSQIKSPSSQILTNEKSSENGKKARLAILELAHMISVPMALTTILRLKVPSIIFSDGKNTPLTPSEIATKISPDADHQNLQRLLRILTSYAIFNEHADHVPGGERRFSLTETGLTLVPDEEGLSLGDYVLQHHQDALMKVWPLMERTIVEKREESLFEVANGEAPYEYYGKNEEMNLLMQRAMAGISGPLMKEVLSGGYDGFGDQNVKTLVDVGGNSGHCLKMIMDKFQGIQHGINFDLPAVVAKASPIPDVTHVGGDILKYVPSGDAIFMKWMLVIWSDEEIIQIFKNCYKALPQGGKLIVCEPVLPENSDDNPQAKTLLSADVFIMTIYGSKGKHRTKNEYKQFGLSVGFRNFRVVSMDYFFTILEFQK